MRRQKIGEKKRKLKKTKKIKTKLIVFIFYVVAIISIVYNIIYTVNTAISSKEYFNLFGISLFRIDNNFNKNALVIVKKVNEKDLKEGDIIAYQVHGQTKINKIFNITDEGYKTKYNQAYYLDIETVNYNQIIGKVIVNIPVIGILLEILQSKVTSIIICIILFMLYNYNNYKADKKIERKRKKLLNKRKERKNVFSKSHFKIRPCFIIRIY